VQSGETVPYNLVQAGAAIGKSKTAILRAIRRGVISARRDEVTGGWAIDPAELHRAFPPVADETLRTQDVTVETGELRELRARLDAAEAAIRFRDETITDLRRRLDRADERLLILLTDQRSAPPAPPARRWWNWHRRS
jgi:hypothetical protein